ncbi:hypothetical protein AB1388_26660 [Streptomyces hydrogenans]|jgi:hypothetical protein|uniref:hypothetical protein n=1 Tax=Streptomyces hydrogenans TaxID=1873719 RepID=UPI00345D0B89
MRVVVQRVRTSWTKASRGSTGATVRNAAPIAFSLPTGLTSALHDVSMQESDSFVPHMSVRDLSDPGLVLKESDGLLRVHRPETTIFSMPQRNRRPPALRLTPGQWLQWQINYRFVGTWGGPWSYRLDTFNVAYCPASPEVFLGTPVHHVDERAPLR